MRLKRAIVLGLLMIFSVAGLAMGGQNNNRRQDRQDRRDNRMERRDNDQMQNGNRGKWARRHRRRHRRRGMRM